jgi:LacI family transcriptional regulator
MSKEQDGDSAQGRASRRVSIRQVAERAGVSSATVSRVLTGSANVRGSVRDRVLAAMQELNYRPNRLAQSLRRQHAQMIGIVVSDIENPHFTEMVRAVEDGAFRRGFRVLLCNTDEDPEKQAAYLQMLEAERVVGVIVSPCASGSEEVSALIDSGIDVVAFDRVVEDPRADAVLANNFDAAQLATNHLIEQGHTRIGLVGGSVEVATGAERLRGYQAAMASAGLEPLAADGGFRIEGGELATGALLRAYPRPSAIVVANNLMTIGTLRALRAASIAVRTEMALVAIDDPFWADLVEPPITALAQPVREMAESALTLLFERIENNRTEPKRISFDFQLTVRQSSHSLARAR